MRVYVCYHLHGPNGLLKNYDCARPPMHCCEMMAREWDGIVTLGVVGHVPVPENIGLVIATAYHWADGETLTAVTPIRHCPWCGSEVRVFLGDEDAGTEDGDDFIPF